MMNRYFRYLLFILCFQYSYLAGTEFTICSYNCGGLSEHYDYLRAACMQKLMQERFNAEPDRMMLNEKIQTLALKMQFGNDADRIKAKQEWHLKGYQHDFEMLVAPPTTHNSPNVKWNQKANETLTSYKVRPIVIADSDVQHMLYSHLNDLSDDVDENEEKHLQNARTKMAQRIFHHQLKYDIICLQEADYLNSSLFPKHYEVLFADSSHSLNGIAWNTNRFELIKAIGDIAGRAFAVQLADKENGKTVIVASAHLTGCNPYQRELDPSSGISDSVKGDTELQAIIQIIDQECADIKIIGMDSNVTSLHPRLTLLKDAAYEMDAENFLEATCTNPYQMLNTRIDWIVFKASKENAAAMVNIPVLSVGLNNIQTNISDHKPIAAKIIY